jgi:sec-independent protein translocase protein TatC
LFYTNPTGGFDFLIRLCLFFGMFLSVPVFTYHLLRFIEPTLARKTKYLIVKLLLSSLGLALIGAGFAYFISMPAALHFLGGFGSAEIKSLISTDEYLHFVMIYIAGYAALFQLPLILMFINWVRPLPPKRLMKQQRWVILGSFLIAAILTPTPDPLNQAIMAGPMIALYELSLGMIWLANRKRQEQRIIESELVEESSLLSAVVSERKAAPGPAARPTPTPGIMKRTFTTTRLPQPQPLSSTLQLQALQPPPVKKSAWVVNLIGQAPVPPPRPMQASRPAIASHAPRPIQPSQALPPSAIPGAPIDLSRYKQAPSYRPSRNIIDMRPKSDGNPA